MNHNKGKRPVPLDVQSLQAAATSAIAKPPRTEDGNGRIYFDGDEQRRQFKEEIDRLRAEDAISADEHATLDSEYERIQRQTYDRLSQMTAALERRVETSGEDEARRWLAAEAEDFRQALERAPEEVAAKLPGA